VSRHRFGFTAQNAYRGLLRNYLLFDALDTGDEGGPLFLPRIGANGPGDGDNVVTSQGSTSPLVFTDKVFDPDTGQQFFDLFNTDGILGDKFLSTPQDPTLLRGLAAPLCVPFEQHRAVALV